MSTGQCVQTDLFGFLVGPPGDLSAALHIVERDGLCWPPPQRRQVPPLCPARAALRLSPHCHLRSLSPVRGSLSLAALLALCEEGLQGRLTKLKESLVLLHEMGDSQLEATLLRSCFALPKFSYVIRTCPPTHVSQDKPVGMSTVPSLQRGLGVHPGGASD